MRRPACRDRRDGSGASVDEPNAGRAHRRPLARRARRTAGLGRPQETVLDATDLRRDCRYALRTLLREPGLTAVIVLTLALGIGATAAIFSAIDAVLLRRAPVADADRVVNVYTVWSARATANRAAISWERGRIPTMPTCATAPFMAACWTVSLLASITLSLDAHGLTEANPAARS